MSVEKLNETKRELVSLKEVFSIYDSKAEVFHQPMFLNTKGEAIRSFIDEVNREGSPMNIHPEDYTLFHIGSFNQFGGKILPLSTPNSMAVAIECINHD